jgi:hypothetical protein
MKTPEHPGSGRAIILKVACARLAAVSTNCRRRTSCAKKRLWAHLALMCPTAFCWCLQSLQAGTAAARQACPYSCKHTPSSQKAPVGAIWLCSGPRCPAGACSCSVFFLFVFHRRCTIGAPLQLSWKLAPSSQKAPPGNRVPQADNASACSCCKHALATGHASGCTWKKPSQRRPAAAPAAAARTHSRCTPENTMGALECCVSKATLLDAPAAAASMHAQQKCQWPQPECCVPHSALLVCLQSPAAAASTHSHCATGSTVGAPRVLHAPQRPAGGPIADARTPSPQAHTWLFPFKHPAVAPAAAASTHSRCTPGSTMGAP